MPRSTIRYINKNFDEAAVLACLADIAFEPGFQVSADNQSIVAALRRASEEFRYANIDEMKTLLADYSETQIAGLVNNIKGIAFEMEFVKLENEDGDGVFASLYPDTNNPGFDVDVSCGFEYGTCRAGDHIDHGGKGLRVAVSTGTRPGGLEKTVQSFHAGIGIG